MRESADGVWSAGEPLTVAQIARGGPAWLCLDAQHGAFDDAAVLASLRALDAVSGRPRPSASGSPGSPTR